MSNFAPQTAQEWMRQTAKDSAMQKRKGKTPPTPTASDTEAGLVELATSAETITGTDATRAVTPAGFAAALAAKTASTTAQGIVELATDGEVQTGTDTARAVTPAGLASLTATTSRRGLAETATDAEALTGTDTSRYVTPANLDYVLENRVSLFQVIPSALSVTGGSGSVSSTGEVTITGSCTQVIIQGAFPTPFKDFYVEWVGATSVSTSLLARLAVTTSPITTTTYAWHTLAGQNATTYPVEGASATSWEFMPGTTRGIARAWFADPNQTVATQMVAIGGYGGASDSTIRSGYGLNTNATAYASLVILVASGTFTGRFRIHAVPV